MENFQPQCKLCGGTVRDDHFRGIDDEIERIFNVLLLTLSSDKDVQYVLCEVCSSKLFVAFNFKSTCLHIDNSIKLYVDSGNPAPVDLKNIYAKQKGKKQGEICRLCFQPMEKSEQKSIQEVSLDSIQIYIPEINFALTSKPAICLNCFDSLLVHSTFIKNWNMEEKKKIKGTLTCAKTEDVEIEFEEAKEGEMPFEILDSDVKKEEVEEGGSALVSSNGVTDVVQVKTESDGDAQQQEINAPPAQMHRCSQCPYQTSSRLVLANHELKHRDPLENMTLGPCIHTDDEGKVSVNDTLTNSSIKIEGFEIKYEEIDEEELSVPNYYSGIKKQDNREGDPGYFNQVAESVKTESQATEEVENNVLDNDRCSYESRKKRTVQKHKCDVCGVEMRYKKDLKRHQLKHKDPSEVLMYMCDVCGLKIRDKHDLKRHQLRHKDPSEVRMYQCGVCALEFKDKRYLKRHQLKHAEPSELRIYKCDECDYNSYKKHYLDSHKLIHKDPSELKMYKCEICFYESRYRRSLIRHQLKHKDPSETRTFLCEECAFETKYKNALKTHQLRHKHP